MKSKPQKGRIEVKQNLNVFPCFDKRVGSSQRLNNQGNVIDVLSLPGTL